MALIDLNPRAVSQLAHSCAASDFFCSSIASESFRAVGQGKQHDVASIPTDSFIRLLLQQLEQRGAYTFHVTAIGPVCSVPASGIFNAKVNRNFTHEHTLLMHMHRDEEFPESNERSYPRHICILRQPTCSQFLQDNVYTLLPQENLKPQKLDMSPHALVEIYRKREDCKRAASISAAKNGQSSKCGTILNRVRGRSSGKCIRCPKAPKAKCSTKALARTRLGTSRRDLWSLTWPSLPVDFAGQ